ncbi:acylneuraminate cytidylyltransferase family protein [Candidatus Thioglobus sp.]|nr:acylneuraminate cytidylyltransferase family protein [Candidatus Thioglobus sp.]
MKNILAIIPARGGSKRVPKKNLKEIDGIPLVAIAVNHAKDSQYINHIFVSTDDAEIGNVSAKYGAEVIDRPEHLRNDNTLNEADNILCDVVEKIEKKGIQIDIVVLLYPTAPLRTVEKIDEAINLVLDGDYDSSLSLVQDQGYFWRLENNQEEIKPYNYDPLNRLQSDRHPFKQFKENKAIYVCTRDLLINTRCRLGGKVGHVTMSSLGSVDIDTFEDLDLCRILYKK